ncbi:MAG: hypothetical protein A2583_06025 [Bdellovibrionales bacterium RIFOXYD1_FULL_53_11]|nr:MAG: hypothetical protein A2583_06025 [Bdellovibrionales bacterium RIFOXYD1_FULL_53_11]
MGLVVPFSEFKNYYAAICGTPTLARGTVLDTNILISLTYEVKNNHDEVAAFFQECLVPERDGGFRVFTTVNTRSEFLDFIRRLLMTENLRDVIDESSAWKIPARAKAHIQYQSGLLKRREQQSGDPVFNDTQIKMIKSSFSAGNFSGNAGWLVLCQDFLDRRLDEFEEHLAAYGIEYISQHEPDQEELFRKKIDWHEAKRIAEVTCLSLSDAMIINAFQCSRFPFIVSSDFDLGYAVLASKELKDVVMPDSVVRKYRDYHFEEYTE